MGKTQAGCDAGSSGSARLAQGSWTDAVGLRLVDRLSESLGSLQDHLRCIPGRARSGEENLWAAYEITPLQMRLLLLLRYALDRWSSSALPAGPSPGSDWGHGRSAA